MFTQILKKLFGIKSRTGRRGYSVDREMVRQKFSDIKNLVKMGGESRLRSAVVEADKILDYTLRAKGFKGETLGERLKSSEKSMSRAGYNAAWQAHKLRNRLVHELDSDVLYHEVKDGMANFEMALRDLGAL